MGKPAANNARVRRVVTLEGAVPDRGASADDEARQMREGELECVMAASSSALLPSIIRLAVETAMRREEIAGLRWEHIDPGAACGAFTGDEKRECAGCTAVVQGGGSIAGAASWVGRQGTGARGGVCNAA